IRSQEHIVYSAVSSISPNSKRMRPMGPQGELYLHKQFVGIEVFPITGQSVLAADLREFAGPVGQHQRSSFVIQMCIERPVRIIDACSDEPAAGKLVIARSIKAECALKAGRGIQRAGDQRAREEPGLLLLSPDELAAGHE